MNDLKLLIFVSLDAIYSIAIYLLTFFVLFARYFLIAYPVYLLTEGQFLVVELLYNMVLYIHHSLAHSLTLT